MDGLNAQDGKKGRFMDYTKLGNTGMDVSRICLGCMGFGDASRWIHKWVLNEENSRPIIKKALDLGVNFFDTANVYSIGTSEEILGRALKDFANRDEIVIATKLHGKMHDGPNGSGLSRKAILSEIDKSLKRLETDYLDLYIIHRWDEQTPIEETMEALHDVVKAGKARYIGASAMWAWQFQKALHVAEQHGWTRFVSMHWPDPTLVLTPDPDDGPVLITVEYRVPAERTSDFLAAMNEMRLFRRREGAVSWGIFRDLADPDRYLETFVAVSWGEHVRQHARVTVEDEAIEARAFAFLQEGVAPVAAHLIAARAYDDRAPAEPLYAELS
jgi:hypothetical protein